MYKLSLSQLNASLQWYPQNIFEGFNATVFAYGQTGSGKTHTMGNVADNDLQEGIIPSAVKDIFAKQSALEEKGATVDIQLSYMEVYMEECFDLLSTEERKKIDVRETTKGETIVEGLTSWPVHTLENVSKYLADATKNRATGRTAMNSHSSRSHAICTFTLRTVKPIEGVDDMTTSVTSKLHLVDLAGSERAKKTKAEGEQFAEGVSINKGLLALGNVISALSGKSDKEKENELNGGKITHTHVPYRESKLTRLLKDALGGNGMTVMIACTSPSDTNYEETLNTLRFASRALNIVNSARVNVDDDSEDRKNNETLIKEVQLLRQQIQVLQLRNELFSQKANLHQQPTAQNKSQKSEADFQTKKAMIVSGGKMAEAMKTLLTKCEEENVTLEDDVIENIKANVLEVRKQCQNKDQPLLSSEEVEESHSVVDQESSLHIIIDDVIKLASSVSNNTTSITSESKIEDGGIVNIDNDIDDSILDESLNMSAYNIDLEEIENWKGDEEYAREDEKMQKDVLQKEQEINQMLELTTQFHDTINQLKDEISTLQQDKDRLTKLQQKQAINAKNNRGFGSSTNLHEENKIKKELREKSKSLEEKLKELRLKESQYKSTVEQKERALKEAENLRKEIDAAKKKRADLQRKMAEENAANRLARKNLQQDADNAKSKQMKAQSALQRLEGQLANKERVWREQLAAKERESKKLKELTEKQEKVKAHREMYSMKNKSNALAKKGHGYGNEELTQHRISELKAWISAEAESQIVRNNVSDDLQKDMELRMKATKKLQQLRQQSSHTSVSRMAILNGTVGNAFSQLEGLGINAGSIQSSDTEVEITSSSYGSHEAEIKALEEELRKRSKSIAQHQGHLADLGAVVEKRRFAQLTDIKETKVVLGFLFEMLTREKQQHIKSLESKVATHENTIESLRKQVHAEAVNEGSSSGSNIPRPNLSVASKAVAPNVVKLKERKPLHAPKSGLEGVLREVKNNKCQSKLPTDNNTKQEESDDDMDESFYPSDDDEDSDYDSDDSLKRKRRQRSNRGRTKRSKSGDGVDASLNSSSEVSSDAELVVLPIDKELTKYTVKELKELLASRGLKVSGVKEDLIQRLQSFENNMTSMLTDVALSELPVTAPEMDPPVHENVFAPVISSPFGSILLKTASSSSTAMTTGSQPSVDEPDKPDSAVKRGSVQQASIETAKDTLKSISVDTQLFPSSDPNFFKKRLYNPDNDENMINLPIVDADEVKQVQQLEVMDTEDFASL